MAVEGVIFDVSNTLVTSSGSAAPGAVEAIERLRGMGVQIIAVSNDPPKRTVEGQLMGAGLHADYVYTSAEIGKNKGSPLWIDRIKADTGLATNQLLYVGDSKGDMITASHAKVVYFHAEWVTPHGMYGFPAPAPGWIAAIVEHIFRKQHLWYWTLDASDTAGRRVRQMAMIDGNGAGDDVLKSGLIDVFKRNQQWRVGQMTLRDFVMLHLVASLYAEGLVTEANWWTTYPGSTGQVNDVMGTFLDVAAKLFRKKYNEDLIVRHQPAMKSKPAYERGQIRGAFQNQLDTVHLNPNSRHNISNSCVLILDNFITRAVTVEAGRNLLLAGGASDVVSAGIGKYGEYAWLFAPSTNHAWNPYSTTHPPASTFRNVEVHGNVNGAALDEFVASHKAMKHARW